ncbi:MAG TPA: lysozyme inhibitor LprI family protein [Pyrinomonadaceae bacterium]|nr:lysozyme inhibitor LprI family protein [Pyrinomonadaceae bacterium]
MKLSALLFSIGLCFLVASNVPAQNPQTTDPCADAQTTVEMRDCAGKEYKQADAELNAVYKRLMATLSDKAEQASLKSAQQAWLKYRDANCEFDAFENRGGTIYPVVYTSCLTAMTRARTKELQEEMAEGH